MEPEAPSQPTPAASGSPPPARRPAPTPGDATHLFFQRGKSYPRAIAWLGFSSFWGHLWHLAASVLATEDIDARDWMDADPPDELTQRVARQLGAAGPDGQTVTELLGRDLWVDFIADTGDDPDVSHAVATMLFRDYLVPGADGEILAPRGDVLMFGGDTAYPVATQIEIHNRVCIPFNRVLREVDDGHPRVLMGIPGNHDWYDGLDGFARMFRARRGLIDRGDIVDDRIDTSGPVGHLIDWVEAFRVGTFVAKRAVLPLIGYTPVQNASYFVLRLAPELDLWAVDRQLRALDYTQRSYFGQERSDAPTRPVMLAMADPAYAMLAPCAIGLRTLDSVGLSLEKDNVFVVTGDTHHYCRQQVGRSIHMIAGGGGAFLHPARIQRRGYAPPDAEFPGPRASFALAMQVPWQIAGGRAGFVVHVVMALMYLPILMMHISGQSTAVACAVVGLISTFVCGMVGGWRQRNALAIAVLAGLCGAWVGGLPYLLRWVVAWLGEGYLTEPAQAIVAYVAGIYPATLGFGTYLMVLTILGLEQHQAFSALAHPGYKHFTRLRVRADGSGVDAWVLGKIDTLDPKSKTVLVDHFCWDPNDDAG